jgi:hypothetical protein
MIRATAEVFVCHRDHHAESPRVALGLTLRKCVEMGDFGGGEKHGGCIRARGDAGSAADARSCIKRNIRSFLWDQDHVGIRSATRGRADEAPCLNDSVKSRSVDDQIPDHREGAGAPRLERKSVAIPEEAHRELAHCGTPLTSVGHTVDQEAARTADALAAIVLEGNGSFVPVEEILIESVERLQE